MSAAAARFELPASSVCVELRQPTGADDLLLLERNVNDIALALVLAQHLAHAADGSPLQWETVPLSDLDVFIVRLRQLVLGDRIIADIRCRDEACGARVDLSFSLEAYLAHHRPAARASHRRNWAVAQSGAKPGWYELAPKAKDEAGPGVRFRLPTASDVLACPGDGNLFDVLWRRCAAPERTAKPLRRRAEAAMEALAPALSGALAGICPECATPIDAYFEARSYCLMELRDRARFVYEDVDVLAQRYHWSERAILALPNVRRASYVEFIRQSGAA